MNPNDPAFPAEWVAPDDDCGQSKMWYAKGMTNRDYIALSLLQGILVGMFGERPTARPPCDKTAAWAYEYADAMIAESSK